jgi:sulfoacetaldehyde dehydrogenase
MIEHKVIKNHCKTLGLLRDLSHAKTVGVIDDESQNCSIEIGRPVAVIGAIVPSTNPMPPKKVSTDLLVLVLVQK